MVYLKNYKHWLILGVFLLLLIIPFRWFANDAIDACGDDPKMQFYAPEKYIENYSLYTWSSYNALSVYTAPHPNLLFTCLPLMISKMGFTPAQSQKFFYGLILALGFLFVFLFIKEITTRLSNNQEVYFWPALIGGLLYVFSPLVQYYEWMSRLSSIFSIFLYPAMLYFFLKAVNKQCLLYLFPGALLSAVFAFAIYTPSPWMLAFFIGAVVFLSTFFFILAVNKAIFMRTILIYVFLIILVNFQSFAILLDSIFSQYVLLSPTGVISSDVISNALPFITNIASNFNCFYSFLMLPSKDFLALGSMFKDFSLFKSYALFIALPIMIFMGFVLSNKMQRKVLIVVAIPFLLMLYFMTVSITDLGPLLFGWMVGHIPGFIAFRNFYGKFPIAFSFFYSIFLGLLSAIILLNISVKRFKFIFVCVLMSLAIYSSWPLISGLIIGISSSSAIHEKLCPVIPQSHLKAVSKLEELEDNHRVSIFPVSFAQYMCFRGSNNQFYIGVPFIKILTGHDEMGGIWSYTNLSCPQIPTIVTQLLADYDIDNYSKILWLFNVDYLYIYNEVAPESAQMFIYKYPFNLRLKKTILSKLPLKEIGDYDTVKLYKIDYLKQPGIIQAKSVISKVDKAKWFSKLIYSEYLDPDNQPQIVYSE